MIFHIALYHLSSLFVTCVREVKNRCSMRERRCFCTSFHQQHIPHHRYRSRMPRQFTYASRANQIFIFVRGHSLGLRRTGEQTGCASKSKCSYYSKECYGAVITILILIRRQRNIVICKRHSQIKPQCLKHALLVQEKVANGSINKKCPFLARFLLLSFSVFHYAGWRVNQSSQSIFKL